MEVTAAKWVLIVLVNFQMPMFELLDTREQCRARIEELTATADPGRTEAVLLCVRPDRIVRVKFEGASR